MKFKKSTIALFLCTLLILCSSPQVVMGASSHGQNMGQEAWLEIKNLADQAYREVKEKDYAQARQTVERLSDRLLDTNLGEYVPYVEQAKMLFDTVLQAKGALTAVRLDERQAYLKVLRMRLAVDAVLNKEQAMWIQFYPELNKVLNQLSKSLAEDKRDQFYSLLNRLFNHYEFIRPAIVVSQPPLMVAQLDSLITFMDRQSPQLWQNKSHTQELLDRLNHLLQIAFYQADQSFKEGLIWLTMGVALVISSVLTYVGWKKYKGQYEQQAVPLKRERAGD